MSRITSDMIRAKGFVPSGVPGKMMRLAVPAAPVQAPPRPSRLNTIERRWLGILVDRYPKSRINPQFRVRVSAFESATVRSDRSAESVPALILMLLIVAAFDSMAVVR